MAGYIAQLGITLDGSNWALGWMGGGGWNVGGVNGGAGFNGMDRWTDAQLSKLLSPDSPSLS